MAYLLTCILLIILVAIGIFNYRRARKTAGRMLNRYLKDHPCHKP